MTRFFTPAHVHSLDYFRRSFGHVSLGALEDFVGEQDSMHDKSRRDVRSSVVDSRWLDVRDGDSSVLPGSSHIAALIRAESRVPYYLKRQTVAVAAAALASAAAAKSVTEYLQNGKRPFPPFRIDIEALFDDAKRVADREWLEKVRRWRDIVRSRTAWRYVMRRIDDDELIPKLALRLGCLCPLCKRVIRARTLSMGTEDRLIRPESCEASYFLGGLGHRTVRYRHSKTGVEHALAINDLCANCEKVAVRVLRRVRVGHMPRSPEQLQDAFALEIVKVAASARCRVFGLKNKTNTRKVAS